MHKEVGVRIVDAATLVCLRRGVNAQNQAVWQVLLGQNEVVNWLRSTPQKLRFMRYPGEWKFPGGSVDTAKDATLVATAIRESQEEFLGLTIKNPRIYFFNELLTKPVQQTRHRMHNFIALQQENAEWLSDPIVAQVNRNLSEKRRLFFEKLQSDGFFHLDRVQQIQISPEIVRIQWFPIQDAIAMMLTSLPVHIQQRFRQLSLQKALEMVEIEVPKHFGESTEGKREQKHHQQQQQEQFQQPPQDEPLRCVDAWQAQEFAKYGITRRDPMFKSMQLLMQIAQFESIASLQSHVMQLEPNKPQGVTRTTAAF